MALKPDEILILKIVKKLQVRGIKVFPKFVLPEYGMTKWEQTVRKKMVKLAKLGYLERVGGERARQGYRLSPGVLFV